MAGHTRLGTLVTQSWANTILTDLETLHSKHTGRGVLSGLEVSAGVGLAVAVTAGEMVGLKPTTLGAGEHTLPASSTRYLWRDESGAFLDTATAADPGGTYVCLGSVTTSDVAVTGVAATGRMALPRWTDIRTYRIGNSDLVVDLLNNRVGIGTVTPSASLDIAGSFRASSGLVGFFGATPTAKTVVPAGGAMGVANGAFTALAVGAAYSQAEVTALRDLCATLRDDVAALHTQVETLRAAVASLGLV